MGQQSGFFGAPAHGLGIVGCAGGAGWPFAFRASDSPCSLITIPSSWPAAAGSGFGVWSSEHDHGERSAGIDVL